MPLAHARCPACNLPLGDPPHALVAVTCERCGHAGAIALAADGQPADFDAAFGPAALLAWFRAARAGLARGALGVAIGACARCRAPLVLPHAEPLSLPCPHCGVARAGTARETLHDQWTEPWARVEGGGLSLEYRLSTGDPGTLARSATSRPPLAVRIDGTRGERPVHALVPIAAGEAALHRDATLGSSAEAGRSMLGVAGLGCAIAVLALVVAVALVILALTLGTRP